MPLLPLPLGGAAINAGDLPVIDVDSIAALEPYLVRDSDSAPIRDAIRAGLTAMFTYYQDQTSIAAMQSNVLFATGIYLDGLGRDEGVFRQEDVEPYNSAGDAAYRARIILRGGTVTPQAIVAAVNTLLAPYSTVTCKYFESMLDRGFCGDGTSTYIAYLRNGSGTVLGDVNPTYPDRLYKDDAAVNNGQYLASRAPGGFFCFSDTFGRLFVIRIPVLSLLDTQGAFAFDGTSLTPETVNGFGLFCSDGSVAVDSNWTFLRDAPATAQGVYQTIVNTVNRLIGHSIRWELIPDPLLQ